MSLFGNTTNKPTLNLGLGTSTANTNSGSSLFGNLGASNTNTNNQPSSTQTNTGSSTFGGFNFKSSNAAPSAFNTTSTQQQPTQNTNNPLNQTTTTSSSSQPQIDVNHLRSTTKYDHLTPDLQSEIQALDTAILNQQRQSTELSDLLPSVVQAGSQISPAIDYVNSKLDELETGLENDADAIVSLRDGSVKKDEGEAKCVFRATDRLRIPKQYQVGGDPGNGFGGLGTNGVSGWWNQPQTLRGNVRGAGGAGAQNLQLVNEDIDDDGSGGPKNLVDLFGARCDDMRASSRSQMELLGEIENFVGGLEDKVVYKERDLNERLESGFTNGGAEDLVAEERERQVQLLKFVFGEVQRSLYEVAEKVGNARDGIVELGMRR